jgi:hypothetical protein
VGVLDPVSHTYGGYLASLDDHGDEVSKVDDVPEGLSFDEVVDWATERAAQVFLRPHWDSGTTYWAGDGGFHSYPVLDRSRRTEAADRVDDRPTGITGLIANCAHCDWCGTFEDEPTLVAAYAAHARDVHAGQSSS